ncbi:hypothetical protein ACIG5E_27150 [Kitasatospora sp. NPDC053057]
MSSSATLTRRFPNSRFVRRRSVLGGAALLGVQYRCLGRPSV